jgi:hypothetical protein
MQQKVSSKSKDKDKSGEQDKGHPQNARKLTRWTMPYHIVSQHEHGGYRCETKEPDLASAISLTLAKAKESRRKHYIVDEYGRLVDIINPY